MAAILSDVTAAPAVDDPTDSQVVRLNFRKAMRASATAFSAIVLFYGALYWAIGSTLWIAQPFVAAAILALGPSLRDTVSLRRFIVASLALFLIAVGAIVHLWLTLGVDALPHLLLICLTPMIVLAGRIGLRSKLVATAALCAVVLMLDRTGGSPQAVFADDASRDWAIQLCREANLAVACLTAPLMLLQYFKLVCSQQAQLLDLALRDPLTKLFNRRHAHEVGALLLSMHKRDERQVFSVVMLDVDHFKSVNDRHGHDGGDAALKHVAGTLASVCRACDTTCRWGGEEFLVLLPGADEGSGVVLAERLRSALEQSRLRFGDQTIPLTATFGVSQASRQDAWDAVIQRADEALYVGKKERGRNCVVPASSMAAAASPA